MLWFAQIIETIGKKSTNRSGAPAEFGNTGARPLGLGATVTEDGAKRKCYEPVKKRAHRYEEWLRGLSPCRPYFLGIG